MGDELEKLSGEMTQEEVNAAIGKLNSALYDAVDQVIADFFDSMPIPPERLYIAFSMAAYQNAKGTESAERMAPLVYWKTVTGQTVGNSVPDGYGFGSHMRTNLETTCNNIYSDVKRGLLENVSEKTHEAQSDEE